MVLNLKVMLHRTIRNDDFSATQRCNVGTMLESSRLTSPLKAMLHETICNDDF